MRRLLLSVSPRYTRDGSKSCSFRGSAPLSPFFFYSTAASTPTLVPSHHLDLSTAEIVRSFKDWFKCGAHSHQLLNQIFDVLRAASSDGDDRASDLRLSRLRLRLSEQLVLQVLSHGRDDILSCLKFFDWAARQPGFHHTRATFHAIFKILRRARLMPLMLDFLDKSVKFHGFRHSLRLCDALVIGYAVAGRPDIALQHFGNMRFRGLDLDSFGYHVLLNALVEESCFDTVDTLVDQISARGFLCTVTHSILVKSYCKQGRLAEAERYFRGLLANDPTAVGCASAFGLLVDSLCSHNMFHEAARLLDEIRGLRTVPVDRAYSIWIKALIRAGNLDGAVHFLRRMSSLEGYVPEVFRYNTLVLRLLRENRLTDVCDILIEMKEQGILPDKGTMNAVLCFFCKAGMVDVALELYRSRSEIGLTTSAMAYNYLINTLCGDGSVDEAYGVLKVSLDQGHFPGRKTFGILTEALCQEGKVNKMKELVLVALERNFMPSSLAYDKFISALCEAGRVQDGFLIHEELKRAGIGTTRNMFISLIWGLVKPNRGDIAAKLLVEMQEKGYTPTRILYRAVIRCLCSMENHEKNFFNLLEMQLSLPGSKLGAYNSFIDGAGHAGRPELARVVYEMMGRDGIEPNTDSNVLMLQSYVKNGKVSDALNFFDVLRQKGMIRRRLYHATVVGLCEANKGDIAIYFLQEMRHNGLRPSIQCYEEVIQNMCSNKRYDMAVGLVNEFRQNGWRLTSFIGNVLLFNALKSQGIYEAWNRMRDVEEEEKEEMSDMRLLGKLIGVFSGRIGMTGPIKKLDKIIEKCYPVDIYTYNLLLGRVIREEVGEAYEMFDRMHGRGYEPNQWTYRILVRGLRRAGRMEEANKWSEAMFGKENFASRELGCWNL